MALPHSTDIAAHTPRQFRRALLELIAADLAYDRGRYLLDTGQTKLRHGFYVGGRHLGYEAAILPDGRARLSYFEPIAHRLRVGPACLPYFRRDDIDDKLRAPLAERLAAYKGERFLDRIFGDASA